jgi:ammonia channel protein AmtB
MLALSAVAWPNGNGGHASRAEHSAWLIPAITFLGGAGALATAGMSRMIVRDRRTILSAWTTGLFAGMTLSLVTQADQVMTVVTGGIGLLVAFIATFGWLLGHPRRDRQ